ncbi:MAG: radical SAM protein [Candidatus Omnitrophica bacterium]|nr:radical SAM protein [Candidatus Omnitrophota bacterium]
MIDAIARGLDEKFFLEEISGVKSALLVVETSTPSFENDINISFKMKQNNPGSRLALCGPHASVYAREILVRCDFVDYVFIGEYEYTLLELTEHLEENRTLESVLGLAYRARGGIMVNKRRPAISNLDDLPWPEREEKYIYNYNDGFAGLPVPNVQMYSSRGCPFHCIFCLWPQVLYGEHKYRKRNPVNVVEEMAWLINKFNFKAVYFDDDVFNIDQGHVIGICREMARKGIKVPWAAMARADLMNEEILAIMSDAGLYAVKYGVESANNKVLRLCKKNLNIARAEKMIRYTKRLGVKVHLTFCLGLPGETRQSIQDTVDFISGIKPDSFQFSLATPFPGTDYYRYLKRNGICLPGKLADYDGNNKYAGGLQEFIDLDLERLKDDLCSNLNLK